MKIPPAGIEPATFRFVAQHLNHCITAVPLSFAIPMLFRSVLRREDTSPIVVIGLQEILMTGHKQRYTLSRMSKDFDV